MSDKAHKKLRKYGDVQMCKSGTVFTLLITGEKLASSKVNILIMSELNDCGISEKYPVVECLKNDDKFYLVVLRKNP